MEPSKHYDSSSDEKIVGGLVATPHSFPYQVRKILYEPKILHFLSSSLRLDFS